jgi:ribosomal protein L40E
VAQHVRVDRKGEAGADTDPLGGAQAGATGFDRRGGARLTSVARRCRASGRCPSAQTRPHDPAEALGRRLARAPQARRRG